MSSEKERAMKAIEEGETRIQFLREFIDIQEKAMKRGLPREDVMPEYLEDIEELDELIAVNKALSYSLSEPEDNDKSLRNPFH